ncbi:MAG TPA: hypothetical protein VF970_14540 [Gemmatimonadales bacterium]
MTDERFEEFLRDAAADYHRPTEPPREEMWARIQAERARQPVITPGRVIWVRWGLAAAAVLALGIAIGRVSAPNQGALMTAEANGGIGAYRVAALEHLKLVETFLTVFRAEAAVASMELAPGAAREMLLTTRLVMDSPAGRDPRLAALLQDVELVLAEIASLAGEHDPDELDLIDQGMERHRVLLRLRAIGPIGPAAASVQGEL